MSNRRKVKATAACADCGMFTIWRGRPDEYYMVAGEVWDAAGMDSGYLCIGCLEDRLGGGSGRGISRMRRSMIRGRGTPSG